MLQSAMDMPATLKPIKSLYRKCINGAILELVLVLAVLFLCDLEPGWVKNNSRTGSPAPV